MKFYMTPVRAPPASTSRSKRWARCSRHYIVNLPAGDHLKPDHLAINPKGTIPTLVRNDGTAITEFQAIAWWLARQYPRRGLLPTDAEARCACWRR